MIKQTKRKAFNFLRSYFDVLNELNNDKDKLSFLMAIINKQFLDEDPEDLSYIVKLCYESQRHQIESSVKGWERASNETLGTTPPTTPPTTKQEEEEKGEEKEQYVKLDFVKLLSFINQKTGRKYRTINKDIKRRYNARLKDGYTKQDILNAVINAANLQYHKDNGCQHLTPEFFSRATTLDKYGNEAKGNLIASFPDPVN